MLPFTCVCGTRAAPAGSRPSALQQPDARRQRALVRRYRREPDGRGAGHRRRRYAGPAGVRIFRLRRAHGVRRRGRPLGAQCRRHHHLYRRRPDVLPVQRDPGKERHVHGQAVGADGSAGGDARHVHRLCGRGDAAAGGDQRDPANPGGTVRDSVGEYVEIYNRGRLPANLKGFIVSDNTAEFTETIKTDLIVAAGEYAPLGRSGNTSKNGGITPDYLYTSALGRPPPRCSSPTAARTSFASAPPPAFP